MTIHHVARDLNAATYVAAVLATERASDSATRGPTRAATLHAIIPQIIPHQDDAIYLAIDAAIRAGGGAPRSIR
jgi:hypothetical protein